ncbi:MAG: ABC transporter permease, partial [Deltaproteobacteria bacterium]|nr:ABC transporter permease [Deltaproteobacteria bacterium]
LVGPALAANSIASEREGQTWEAVLLTGMRPAEVARGKFMAAFTAIGMYIVMLAPVGALPFLFGGITPVEVLVAFIFLFLIALLGVAFGLAISSKMASLRGALLVTLLVAIPLSVFCYVTFGIALSAAAHEVWDVIPQGPPVWLPTAYGRVPFGVEYLVYLVAIPTAGIALPAWLLYEVTRSNLTSVTDDLSFGLKKWFLTASVVAMATASIPLWATGPGDRAWALIAGTSFFVVFVLFCAFLFGGETIGPSRRVKKALASAGALRRALSPGVIRTAGMQLALGLTGIGLLCLVGVIYIQSAFTTRAAVQAEQVILFSAYAAGFIIFVIGLTALLRARSTSTTVPRVLLLVMLFFITLGPWILAAITGVLSRTSSPFEGPMAVAAPSPVYALLAAGALTEPDPGVAPIASVVTSFLYAGLGTMLFFIARAKCKGIIADHESLLAEADERLAEEDRVAAEQRAAAEQDRLAALEQQPAATKDETGADGWATPPDIDTSGGAGAVEAVAGEPEADGGGGTPGPTTA